MDTVLARHPTGLEGLDSILGGGLFEGRVTLLAGSSGSGKTLLSLQIIHNQIHQYQHPCVYVSFEESEKDILENAHSLDWDLPEHQRSGKLHIVDASPDMETISTDGQFDLSGILAQLEHHITQHQARFVCLDSLNALLTQIDDVRSLRREAFRLVQFLKKRGVTAILTAERKHEYGEVSRLGIEEFVADGVIILRHVVENERLRRTLQVHKLRGGDHHKGEVPFIINSAGFHLSPLTLVKLTQSSSTERVKSGNKTFDTMTNGGLFRDSVVLLNGPTGAGKTLFCTTFIAGGCSASEHCLYVGFEESRQQLIRNANSWGYDFEQWESEGKLCLSCLYPEQQSLEDHLLQISEQVEELGTQRLVIDSISALQRIGNQRVFQEFVISLTSLMKEKNVCALFTSTSPNISGGDLITGGNISTITDAIILMRYVELKGILGRGMIILKMRGSDHEKGFRPFHISEKGLNIGDTVISDSTIIRHDAVHPRQ